MWWHTSQPVTQDGELSIELVDKSAAADALGISHTSPADVSAPATGTAIPAVLSLAVTAAKDLFCLYGARHRRGGSQEVGTLGNTAACFTCKAPLSDSAAEEEALL